MTSTTPDPATRAAEREDAKRRAGADREPTPEEEQVAEEEGIDDSVVEHEEEMLERGAHQQGEGRIA